MNFHEYCKSFIPHLEKRYKVNLTNPQTLNDKLNWLKVYDCTPLKAYCSDKITFKRYVEDKLKAEQSDYLSYIWTFGVNYEIIPILKTFSSTNEINFDSLPQKCVIKCNHGSGYNIIYDKDTSDRKQIVTQLNTWMNTDYGNEHHQVELHYDLIQKRILAEPFKEIKYDYKFWCFNGKPEFFVVINKEQNMNYYDLNGNKLDIARKGHLPFNDCKLVNNEMLRAMNEMAHILCKDFKFVRVDFAVTTKTIYVTELTFIPGSGCIHYTNPSTDLELGQILKL